MNKYKLLQLTALAVEFITLLVRGYNRAVAPLSDGALRVNGVVMLAAAAVLVFASVRLVVGRQAK